jgi:hypothetical protein
MAKELIQDDHTIAKGGFLLTTGPWPTRVYVTNSRLRRREKLLNEHKTLVGKKPQNCWNIHGEQTPVITHI